MYTPVYLVCIDECTHQYTWFVYMNVHTNINGLYIRMYTPVYLVCINDVYSSIPGLYI